MWLSPKAAVCCNYHTHVQMNGSVIHSMYPAGLVSVPGWWIVPLLLILNVKGGLDTDSLKPHWPYPPGKTLFWWMKMAPSSSSCLTRQIERSKVQFDPCRSMVVNDGEAWKVKAPFLWTYFFLLVRVPAVIWARWFDAEQLLDYSHSDINQHIQKQFLSTTNTMTNSNTLVLKYLNY